MNRKEAVLAMLEGKKVTHKDYRNYPHSYNFFSGLIGFKFYDPNIGRTHTEYALNLVDGYELCDIKPVLITINGKQYLQSDIDKLTPVGE